MVLQYGIDLWIYWGEFTKTETSSLGASFFTRSATSSISHLFLEFDPEDSFTVSSANPYFCHYYE